MSQGTMLEGKVVVVTGAGGGIGRDIALQCAAQGAKVVVNDIGASVSGEGGDTGPAQKVVAEIQAAGGQAAANTDSVAEVAAAGRIIQCALDSFGRIDAVVNNASLFEHDTVADFSMQAMEAHWRANTAPAILLARALHTALDGSGRTGCVVNLLDQKLWNPNPDYLSYTLSKAALQSATTLLAMALAPRVRVCGVAPGVTLLSGAMSEAEFTAAHRMTPLARSSSAEDVARAVHFLLESPAVTGSTLLVDGGQHLIGQPRDVMFLAREAKG